MIRRLRVPGYESLNPTIIESIYGLKRTDPGKRANRLAGGWHSTDQVLATMPGFPELMGFVLESCPGFSVDLVWAIVNPTGVGNVEHGHEETSATCVYYPRSHRSAIVFRGREDVFVRPEAGLLLCFSGDIPHSVETNQSGLDRVSITFDMKHAVPR